MLSRTRYDVNGERPRFNPTWQEAIQQPAIGADRSSSGALRRTRSSSGALRETMARQIDLICAPQLMSAEAPLGAPNGGSVSVLPRPSTSLRVMSRSACPRVNLRTVRVQLCHMRPSLAAARGARRCSTQSRRRVHQHSPPVSPRRHLERARPGRHQLQIMEHAALMVSVRDGCGQW